ncbi:hypothetical protein Bca4012_041049 [Brassica carinata]|uniref:Uncharacterized protein n=1 Tax=Brassica carinata TaxID=52824 RepID=A0A8X7UIB8_BRACI|nr:hypothetical protein Bca52824_061196 [Brassica carinata]
MFSILRNPSCSNCVAIVLRMCSLNTGHRDRERTRLKLIGEEESKHRDVYEACKARIRSCSDKSRSSFTVWLKRPGTGKEPQIKGF